MKLFIWILQLIFWLRGRYEKICCLLKSLYSLKQSSRAWFNYFCGAIISMDFTRCHSDHTCFIHHEYDGRCIFLFVYVDDIIIIGDDAPGIIAVKQVLGN